MRPTPSRCIATLLLSLCVAPAGAGSLEGSVSVGRAAAAGSPRVPDAVIWLEHIPDKTERQLIRPPHHWFWNRREVPPMLATLAQSGVRYSPHVIAIPAGSALVIANQDNVWHGAFSVSPARAFDLGKRAPGRADTLRFDSTGVVAVRCDIHPEMSAFVVVTPNHAFTQPDSAGMWRLPELPAGHYVVHAWSPNRARYRHEVDVPAKGAVKLPIRW